MGGEVTAGYVIPRESQFFGGVAQAEWMGAAGTRAMLAVQYNFLVLGGELGAATQFPGSLGYAQTYFMHLAPYLSLGFGSLAFRIDLPVGTVGQGRPMPVELGLVLTLKWPFKVAEPYCFPT